MASPGFYTLGSCNRRTKGWFHQVTFTRCSELNSMGFEASLTTGKFSLGFGDGLRQLRPRLLRCRQFHFHRLFDWNNRSTGSERLRFSATRG
jgi:hypothetical protein